MTIRSFNSETEFDENRIKTKVLIETTFSKEIRILLVKDQVMKEHKTPYPILIHVLEGKIELGIEGISHLMTSGDITALEGDISHDLTAKENSIVRLTLSKQDRAERINDVINS